MKYSTVEQCIRLNGERHVANAVGHAAAGKPDYCAGSLRKAIRNFKRADSLKLPEIPPELQAICDTLRRKIDDVLMSGF